MSTIDIQCSKQRFFTYIFTLQYKYIHKCNKFITCVKFMNVKDNSGDEDRVLIMKADHLEKDASPY